ncbi:MAG: 50S ribosome-binding GTPase, partial [Alistipes sp.]|nr:50S ribosome-binding GTPase [Alistipes sp.]
TDTVGFIRKLPTHLVDSFKSTLDEVREADILVHVVDISHPGFEEQIAVVDKTLRDICGDAAEKPVIMVFNKIDAFSYTPKDADDLSPEKRENISLDRLKETWMNKLAPGSCVFISAKKGLNIDELKRVLVELQTIDKYHVALPADWRPGDDIIVPAPTTYDGTEQSAEGMKCYDWYFCTKPLPMEKETAKTKEPVYEKA